MRALFVLAGSVGIAVVASSNGCAEAGGQVEGGNLTDAGAVAIVGTPFAAQCNPRGTSWTDLYCSLFGPTGVEPSCSLTPAGCHGRNGLGALSGSGIECYDQKQCRQSFIDKGMVKPSDRVNPDAAFLFGLIRNNGRGFMPKNSDYEFEERDLARIKQWIAAGIPDD